MSWVPREQGRAAKRGPRSSLDMPGWPLLQFPESAPGPPAGRDACTPPAVDSRGCPRAMLCPCRVHVSLLTRTGGTAGTVASIHGIQFPAHGRHSDRAYLEGKKTKQNTYLL